MPLLPALVETSSVKEEWERAGLWVSLTQDVILKAEEVLAYFSSCGGGQWGGKAGRVISVSGAVSRLFKFSVRRLDLLRL